MNYDKFDSENIPYHKIEESKEPNHKQLYWDIAIGLQMVDNLKPSEYLLKLSKDNISGKKSIKEVNELIKAYYKDKDLKNSKVRDTNEADSVSGKIVQSIDDPSFSFRPISLKGIHKDLFEDVYKKHAGKYRLINIYKEEFILNDDTVNYAPFDKIEESLEYDFKEEKEIDYSDLTIEEMIKRIAEFTSSIWQVHPFMEGNTRTVAVFIIKYLNSRGYNITNDLFKDNSRYFRDALVRSNYSNADKDIYPTMEFLIKFYEKLFLNKNHELEAKELIIKELFESK